MIKKWGFFLILVVFMSMSMVQCGSPPYKPEAVTDNNDCDTTKTLSTSDPYKNSWKLVWSDEFDDSSLDTKKWLYVTGKEDEDSLIYNTTRNENVKVENGSLILRINKENYDENTSFTSGRVQTKSLYEPKFGKIEARIKFPAAYDVEAVFKMLGTSYVDKSSLPKCGEIDIAKHTGNADIITGSLSWFNSGKNKKDMIHSEPEVPDADQYHVYAVEWTESYIRWYVDDEEYCYANITDVELPDCKNNIKDNSAFHEPFFIDLSLGLQDSKKNKYLNSDEDFSEEMSIDYVRVYSSERQNLEK